MTRKILIQLGKLGDVINLLPLAYAMHEAGTRVAIMTCARYAPHIDVSYCDVIPFDGEPHEIGKAVEQAKKLSSDVIVTQIMGSEADIKAVYAQINKTHATTESYQKEAWLLAGKLDLWRNQPPLVFDRRSPEREAALVKEHKGKSPLVLVALNGETSSFRGRHLLWQLLRQVYPVSSKVKILDISGIRAERFYDLLGLYEKATCLISADSAPLHLAYACPRLPVVALVQYRPHLWNGSVWRPNHVFHCRYGDFYERGCHVIAAVKSALYENPLRFIDSKSRVIHVYSEYDGADEVAAKTWPDTWWQTPCELGVFGRDSKFSGVKDEKRFPFLKDVMRQACLRAGDEDTIVLTRADTCLHENVESQIMPLSYAHRVNKSFASSTHVDWQWHPSVDLFCFTKKWWRENQNKIGDFVLGMDPYWSRALLDLFKQSKAKDVTGCVYRVN